MICKQQIHSHMNEFSFYARYLIECRGYTPQRAIEGEIYFS